MKLRDKIAIVTGAAQGLGKVVSLDLAKEGANIIAVDINEDYLKNTVNEVTKIGGKSLGVKTDVSNEKEVFDMVRKTLEVFGRVDILVNNAGGTLKSSESIETSTGDDWNRVISVNLTGTFFCCKAVLPVMKTNRNGKIVNVSSAAGKTVSTLTGPAYSSAKAGVLGLTRQLAYEMGPYGININAVAPAIMLTEPRVKGIWYSIPEEKRKLIINSIPLRRVAEPEEIAKVIVFLCTDDASFITGASIDVNGGLFMA